MSLDELVDTLLHEGYALYPYTPSAAKNATPTPFGIVYPPAYAAGSGATFDRLQVECLLHGGTEVSATVLFLQPTGDRHRAVERRVELEGAGARAFAHEGVRGRVSLTVEPGDPARVRLLVENLSEVAPGATRPEALRRSLVSTHVLLRAPRGRFVSPLEADGCEQVNTWPVLATPEDDAVLGAAIFLPDHPRIAPESRGSLFDATEIEEALLLHVHALSVAERREIEEQDDAVRELVERASATGAEELMRLHGLLRPAEEQPGHDPTRGEQEAVVDAVAFRPGAKLVLRLEGRLDPYDRMLDGRTATVERIFVDDGDRVHLGVTVDSDPMREIMRESGRFLFFFPNEVELVAPTPEETR
jgi:hypothetical protein